MRTLDLGGGFDAIGVGLTYAQQHNAAALFVWSQLRFA